MDNFGIYWYIALILLLATVHTLGDVIYKKATMILKVNINTLQPGFLLNRDVILPVIIISLSVCFSLAVRVIYGIILGKNPLSITAGSFLGSIAVFSTIFGKLFFQEQLSYLQLLGIVMIALGIIILV